MYYISLDPENPNKLIYYCRNCGNTDTTISITDVNVIQSSAKQKTQDLSNMINKYTKYDPTLPRVNNILCPNEACPTNTEDVSREIIYMRYDELNMKYLYLCSTCNTVWKTEDKS
jgi:DNA-directed RNA polymerase subunit M/transcription elongation factor TFIIS